MPHKKKVINIDTAKRSSLCDLTQYQSQAMACPVTKNRVCYFIPLSEINGMSSNPGRAGGTQQTDVSELMESLITNPKGQEEPICLEWNQATKEFDIVFGFHREWAINDAYRTGYKIKNHPETGEAGVWAWVYHGSAAERTALQMRENGNKNPQSPATKQQMVDMLRRYIDQGGLTAGYSTPFDSLIDEEKYKRAQVFMKSNTPYWGGRKFKGVWNALTQDGKSSFSLDFTTYSKDKMAQYFCNNNPYGIKIEDLKAGYSGSVVELNGTKYGVYFVNQRSEIAGALPTNASKSMHKNGIDRMLLVCASNSSTTGNISQHRVSFEASAAEWNSDIFHCFDETFWMPQTQKEKDAHLLSGGWARQQSL